jgi:hypothetical protein
MATIHNSEILREVREGGSLQPGADIIPSVLQNTIVPVMEVNPKLLRRITLIKQAGTASSGAVTVATTATDKETWLVGFSMGLQKDVTCDLSTNVMSLSITPYQSAQVAIFHFPILTLTVQSFSVVTPLPFPIKLTPGSSITISSGVHTAGSLYKCATVWLYEVEFE